jgi:hypothetical protein
MDVTTFHQNLAWKTMQMGNRNVPFSREWIKDPLRETYESIRFSPEKKINKRFYNLWRGFAVEPLAQDVAPIKRHQRALDMFLVHAKENICGNNSFLSHWLLSYLSHMVQKPWEKPLVAIVLRGGKGVGKSAFVGRIRYLFGIHAGVVSHRHRLTGNFNSVLENKVFLTLEEAFWSGDKTAEGVLKELITGDTHSIERKGHESYEVDNCLRLAILGNDKWVVPASGDERRYAVFNVEKGGFSDSDFQEMREAMEDGGYRLLLRFLKSYDISGVSFSRAPKSEGLLEQKIQSLDSFHSWWHESLSHGMLMGSPSNDWPEWIGVNSLRSSLQNEMNVRNIRTRLPAPLEMLGELKRLCPSLSSRPKRADGEVFRAYFFPTLRQARTEWENYIGHKEKWEDEDADLFE